GKGEAGGWSEAVVSHVDVVNSTYITRSNGPYHLYTEVIGLLNLLNWRCREVGCMSFYLGGDNIMLFLPNVETIWRLLEGVETPLRVGVGVSKRPYRAFIKATEALDQLRARGMGGVLVAR
ncbi:MAG: GTP cyclohydrolase IIa, partial [Pyrobaculum sp.]